MTAADRPWWATDEAADRGPTDPLEAHRAARRGDGAAEAAEGAAPPRDEGCGDGATEDDATPPRDERPSDDWWVPATEAVTRLARDLTAAALASPPRGLVEDGRPDPADARRGERASGTGSVDGEASGEDGAGTHRSDTCGVCPVCVGLRALGEARPELVGHLTEAARQLALAVRTVIDAAAPPVGDDPETPGRATRRSADDLHRIDLDD